ncbi:MAG: outer membrane protein assembly factor BamA [Phycisphaerales bacterium]|nr:outer membrane protein assembly factor BamA [Phycisphaerae bacterium]NNF42907.1 outer membrane protein assembly factor BamA [Phycisphaerales bacterium]NNM26281.1 outer membrane protein assembly factor BamA [Phycisphaerales bacterium]
MAMPFLAGVCRAVLLLLLLTASNAAAQELIEWDADLADRPVEAIRIEGASPAQVQLIQNNIRVAQGDPYDGGTLRDDVNRVYRLGQFRFVTAEVRLNAAGGVEVVLSVTPQPLIRAIQTEGNKTISDQDLRAIIQPVPGGPLDQYLIERAKRDIKLAYRKKGYYLTDVSVDETELTESGILIFNIIEGPRVRIKAIEFDGAETFRVKRLLQEIKTRAHVFLLRPGVLDEDVIARDKATLDAFYKARGYLDVRVGHSIQLSPDNREAKVIFIIVEGRRFTLRSVRAEQAGRPGVPLEVFTPEQIAALLTIKTGDVFSRAKIDESVDVIRDAYGLLGYIDVRIAPYEIRHPEPVVDLVLEIREGEPWTVGLIRVNGNFLTKDKVIRRLIDLKPGRPYDTELLRKAEREIRRTRLFNDVRITMQEPDPVDPALRDLLIEVKERNTGSVNFGVAVGSDAGVFGEISIVQNNFDIADFPTSISELIAGRSLRGAGQQFSATFRPGNEIFEYSASLTEPHFLETDYAFTILGAVRRRIFDQYDQERATGSLSIHRSLGDIWRLGFRTRVERVELSDIDPDAPVDVFQDAGPDDLAAAGVTLTRTTVDEITRPTRGSRLELSFDQFGILGGDFEFSRAEAEYTVFVPLDEDFLGRSTTFRLNTRVGYLFGGDRPPIYEQFYMGGTTFRGFDFRTVSPKGIRADTGELGDDPVGGEWMFFVGGQVEFPLFQESITGVVFLDSGTVVDDPGVDDYRVSAGVGVRLYIPELGPVPIAFDFGFPVLEEPGDESRLLSFSAALPF